MTELQKIECFDKIKDLLESLDKETQKKIVWAHLSHLLYGDIVGVRWLLDRVGELLVREEGVLISRFQ
jgi:hypothetical protein